MKSVFVIGIGAGHPDHLTLQAVAALARIDVVFIPDKGAEKDDLAQARRDICARFMTARPYRVVALRDPPRAKSAPDYTPDVEAWRRARATIYRALIADEMKDGENGAFLVWGDPAIYDGTISILDGLRAEGLRFACEVIPGISSVQVLAARHGVALNRIGEAVQITTGRRLARGLPAEAENVVVMLDSEAGLRALADQDLEIFWGAYLGTADEVLVRGKLSERIDEIERIRAAKKAQKGWIMDTYLLRRPVADRS